MMTEPALADMGDGYDADQGSFLRALPGGRGGTPDQIAVALIVFAALAYLFFVRRGFRPVLPG